jgi:1-acyl-sn-glycerol-3-phosphate acyltransferase
MPIIRSTLFNLAFYTWGVVAAVVFSPTLLISRSATYFSNQIWIRGVFFLMRTIMGLKIEIKGVQNQLPSPVIYASKHQSALETMLFHYVLNDPAIVLKRELMWIPFFGWYFKKLGMIPIAREKNKGTSSLRKMLKACKAAVDNNQPIVIFPEGTRSSPDQAGHYQPGVASIYKQLGVPVVPVALNSGCYWPRRGFLKHPGVVTIQFLESIPPGLPRQEFMSVLQSRIETASRALNNVRQK